MPKLPNANVTPANTGAKTANDRLSDADWELRKQGAHYALDLIEWALQNGQVGQGYLKCFRMVCLNVEAFDTSFTEQVPILRQTLREFRDTR